jgi:Leucine-rich repeat (LRR) protein
VCLYVLILLAVAVIGVIVIWVLDRVEVIDWNANSAPGSQDPAAPVVSPQPSLAPTNVPTSVVFALVTDEILEEFGGETSLSLQDWNSPQTKAARWIGEEDQTFDFPLAAGPSVRQAFRQRYALAVFFYSTGGIESWMDDLGFLSDLHECDWASVSSSKGVGCLNLVATEINIPSNGLSGSIPPEFGALERLERLFLPDNGITGSLPYQLYQLTSLSTLFLPFNPLSGSLGPLIGGLRNLQSLWIQKSAMTGTVPPELAELSSLESLILAESSFRGKLPNDLRSLSHLAVLDLKDNFLSGSLPQRIADLPLLLKLDLSLNKFTGTIPVGSYAALEEFVIDSNRFTGPLPTFLLGTTLRVFRLRKNKLVGQFPFNWFQSPSVSDIDVSENSLTGPLPQSLGLLFNLRTLYASGSGLTGTLPGNLGNTLLEVVDVEGNRLLGTVPDSYRGLPLGESVGSFIRCGTRWHYDTIIC